MFDEKKVCEYIKYFQQKKAKVLNCELINYAIEPLEVITTIEDLREDFAFLMLETLKRLENPKDEEHENYLYAIILTLARFEAKIETVDKLSEMINIILEYSIIEDTIKNFKNFRFGNSLDHFKWIIDKDYVKKSLTEGGFQEAEYLKMKGEIKCTNKQE